MKEIKHFQSLGFTVVAEVQSHSVDFKIYDHEGQTESGEPLFHKAGSPSSPDPVESFSDADVYLSGIVKWDGCSDWHFDEQDRVMLHGCCKKDVVRFGLIMGECWDLAAKFLDNFDG